MKHRVYIILLITIIMLSGILITVSGETDKTVILPPNEADAKTRLSASPRHGEWVTIDAGKGDKVDLWVVYPERKDKAPVVIVIHEIYGLNDWARAVADHFAYEGYIAVAPDLLSGKGPGGKGSASVDSDAARKLVSALDPAEVTNRINAAVTYATTRPAAASKFAIVGYCWGGGISFSYAADNPGLSAAVVFYGTSPASDALARIKAPVLGLYGGDDARITAGIPATETEMKRLGKKYETEIYQGAGHAFLRQQDGKNGANLNATLKAWPRTIAFLKDAFK